MGFCLFNNVAVTAAALVARGERVLLVDWDAHHGNGTQAVFYDVGPSVLFVSLHQYPLYPGTGGLDETGEGRRRGHDDQRPVPRRHGRRRLPAGLRRARRARRRALLADLAARLGRLRRPPRRPAHRSRALRRRTSPTSPSGRCASPRRAGGSCSSRAATTSTRWRRAPGRRVAALAGERYRTEHGDLRGARRRHRGGRRGRRRGRRGGGEDAAALSVSSRAPSRPARLPSAVPRDPRAPPPGRRGDRPARRAFRRRRPAALPRRGARSATRSSGRPGGAPLGTGRRHRPHDRRAARRDRGARPRLGRRGLDRRASASARSGSPARAGASRSRRTAPRRTSPTRASRRSASATTSRPTSPGGTSRSTRWRSRCPTSSSIDPFGGFGDLAARRLRTPLDPEDSFSDDPLRMLRAARFLAGYGLEPDPELVAAVERARRSAGDRLGRADPRRARQAPRPPGPRRRASGSSSRPGSPSEFLPELPALALEQDPVQRHKDVLAHTIAVVGEDPPRQDCCGSPRSSTTSASRGPVPSARTGSPSTTTTSSAPAWPGSGWRRCATRAPRSTRSRRLVELHLRFHTYQLGWTDSALRRYARDAGAAARTAERAHPGGLHDPQPGARPGRSSGGWTSSRSASRSCGSGRRSTRSARSSTAAR